MIKEHQSFLRGVHIVLDALLLAAAFRLVWEVEHAVRLSWGMSPLLPFERYGWITVAAALVWVVVLHVTGAYYSYRTTSLRTFTWILVRSGLIVAAILGFLVFAVKDHAMSRALVLGYIPVGVGILSIERLAVKKALDTLRRRDYNLRYLLVLGGGRSARSLVSSIRGQPSLGVKVVGCLIGPDEAPPEDVEVLGTYEDLEAILQSRPLDEVAFAMDGEGSGARLAEWLRLCAREGVKSRFFFLPPSVGPVESYLETLNGVPSISFGMPPSRSWQLAVKRGIDVVVAGMVLVLASPVLLAAALAIRFTSPGPVLFRQVRYGLNKRRFHLFKFRTMIVGAEERQAELIALNEMDGPVFKMRNDPRVTPVGRFLRSTSIDELPQLINVVLGHMSLVGPRPPIPSEVEQYEPWQRRRLSMKPGITGPWQVNGRNRVDFQRWMSMDMDYIDNWTLTKDFEILLKTLPAVVRGVGAW